HVVIATPRCHVETAQAYRDLSRYRSEVLGGRFGDSWVDFRREYGVQAGNPAFYARLHNDFEAPVIAGLPEIRAVHAALEAFGPVKAMLSGSGASVFALFLDEKQGQAACEAVAPLCRFAVTTPFVAPAPPNP